MNQMMNKLMGKMEKVDNALEKIPGKTGVALGAVAGIVVMTSPLAAGIALGAAGVYGAYKLTGRAQQKERTIVDAEDASSPACDV